MMVRSVSLTLLTGCCLGMLLNLSAANSPPIDLRPRLIVETDAGGDPDDEASLVRLLMFSHLFKIEAIIADRSNAQIEGRSSYQNAVKSAGGNGADLVKRYIDDYAQIYPNLVKHDPNYPSPSYLKSITFPGYDSTNKARDALIAVVDRDDPRPVWYGNWGSNSGTTSNLRRALDHIQNSRAQAEYEAFASRLRICSLDGKGRTRQRHEDVIVLHIETGYPDMDGGRWYHRFRPLTENAGGFSVSRDITHNHGNLGKHYTTSKEGDSWTFVHLLSQPLGLSIPTRVTWGGWAGRYAGLRSGSDFPNNAFWWNDQRDTWQGSTNRDNTAKRFAPAMQHHFAARFDWGKATSFAMANHPPIAVVNGDDSGKVIRIFAQPDQTIHLDASASHDPDGDPLFFHWIRYDEADSYSGSITLNGTNQPQLDVTIPTSAEGKNIHLYLEVTDNGDPTPENDHPSLTSYRRIIIYVRNKLKIMCLGDSITDGSHHSDNGNGAYRRKLWELMQAAGWDVDLVGSRQNGGSGMDQDHEGYIGYRIDELYGDADGSEPNVNLAAKLNTYQPDVILLIIGANDALQNRDLANIDHRYMNLLNLIYRQRPEALVVMSNIHHMEKSGYNPDAAKAINAQLQDVFAAAYQIGLWTEWLDLKQLLVFPTDYADGVHPNQQGDDKIGQAFFDILNRLWVRREGELPVNHAPSVDAGADQTIILPQDIVELDPQITDDGLPQNQLTITWVQTAGPASVVIENPHTAHTFATFPQPGLYELKITVDDGQLQSSDTIRITVEEPASDEAIISIISVSTARGYMVVPDVQPGTALYIDRSYTFSTLADTLRGGYLIRTANNDKNVNTSEHITLDLTVNATFYTIYDRRGSDTPPAWLSSWTRTTLNVTSSDTGASPYIVFTRTFAPGTIILGGNKAGGGNSAGSNYTVIVQPQTTPPPSPGPQPFMEENGLLVVEAEHYTALDSRNDPNDVAWQVAAGEPGYAGSGFLTTPLPQGTNGSWSNACEAAWAITIQQPGTYTAWVRRLAPDGARNSAFLGIDDTPLASWDNRAASNQWTWQKLGQIELSAGEHTLQLRRREAGYGVDRILLSLDPGFIPQGEGPAESPRRQD